MKYNEPFTNYIFQMIENDSIFLFSDGYADQIGGQFNKRFRANRFHELLLQIKDKKMVDQKDAIEKVYEDWKGHNEQMDDIMIIGLRI